MQRVWRAQARLRRLLRVVRRVRRRLRNEVLEAHTQLIDARNHPTEEPSEADHPGQQALERPRNTPRKQWLRGTPPNVRADHDRRIAVEEFQKISRREPERRQRQVLNSAAFRRTRAQRYDNTLPSDTAHPLEEAVDDPGSI
jgi:hypothetical protein